MIAVAGVDFPCLDCATRCSESKRCNMHRQIFFSIATGLSASCEDYQQRFYHGIEGVSA